MTGGVADIVSEALAGGEGPFVEFKEAFPDQARRLAEEIAAFSTSGGGVLLLGVDDFGRVVGCDDSRERVEGVLQSVSPQPSATVEVYEHSEGRICVVQVADGSEPVYYVDNRPYLREGSISRPARPDEVKHLILASAALDTDLPTFEVTRRAIKGLEGDFVPDWRVQQVSGDHVRNIEWRFTGPRFSMPWQQAAGARLQETTIGYRFDLSEPVGIEHDRVEYNEIGLELRFHWRGQVRHELHRWPINRHSVAAKAVWDVGDELLPTQEWAE
jgi:hypothetical protein